jgi:hypothetical protein
MKKRPVLISILTWVVITFTTANCLRLYETFINWQILIKYKSVPSPVYITASTLFWIIAGVFISVGLIRGIKRILAYSLLGVSFFLIWFWIDRLVIQSRQNSHLFPMVATAFMILFILMTYFRTRNSYYFQQRDPNDRKSKE